MESHVSHKERLWLYIFCGIIVLYLVAPALIVIPISFSGTASMIFPPQSWSTRWYLSFFGQEKWIGSLWVSLRVATGTMIVATSTGIAASYALHMSGFRFVKLVKAVLVSPLAVPTILISIGIFFTFARIGGLLNTIPGLILGHCVVAMPFVILTMGSAFDTYDMSQEMVARSLGATRLKAFFSVTFPQMKFSVASALLLSFLISFDELIISMMVSSGSVSTLSRVTFAALRDDVDPTLAAVSTLMLIATSIPPLLLHIFTNRARREER